MKRFSNILLVADAGMDRSVALKNAVRLAKSNHATLTVVSVVEDVFGEPTSLGSSSEFREIALKEERQKLDDVIKSIAKADIAIASKLLIGKPFIEIIRQVLRFGHDLVIKSADEDQSLRDFMFCSTDMHLLRKCPCPVWINQSSEKPHYQRVLAALGHDAEEVVTDDLNRQILEMSTSLALSEFSELHIVHAWRLSCESFMRSPRTGISDTEVDAMVARTAAECRCWLEDIVTIYSGRADKDAIDYLKPQLHVIKGTAAHIVPTIARELDVDLVIMGTVGRTGIPGFFIGNTAESILAQLDCSVLAIKPAGFVSPITAEAEQPAV